MIITLPPLNLALYMAKNYGNNFIGWVWQEVSIPVSIYLMVVATPQGSLLFRASPGTCYVPLRCLENRLAATGSSRTQRRSHACMQQMQLVSLPAAVLGTKNFEPTTLINT